MQAIVVTADQRGSRRAVDRVPEVLRLLADVPVALAFDRTTGDEVQGVLTVPEALPQAVEALLRDGGWHVGVGVGDVDEPLTEPVRAGRGEAFVAAREAVNTAKSSPVRVRVVGDSGAARDLESALLLWAALLGRRTAGGWEVADLLDSGLSGEETAARLGISPSAVSQRSSAAAVVAGRRGRELVERLAQAALEAAP